MQLNFCASIIKYLEIKVTCVFTRQCIGKLDGVALLVADQTDANSTTDTDTHLLIDIGQTLST